MKLCFLHGGFSIYGGIERVLSIIAPALEQRNIADVYCISLVKSEPLPMYQLPENLKMDGLFLQKINMRSALLKGGVGKLVAYIKKYEIDVIVACGVIYFPMASMAGKLAGIKVLCWEHTKPGTADMGAIEQIGRFIGAVSSDRNVLISQGARNYYCTHFRKKNNVIINNPAAEELFANPVSYDQTSSTLISVGRLCYQKNFSLLIDIAEKLLREKNNWRWEIFGDGPERTELETKIAEKGLVGKVILKGNVDDLYDRYPQYAAIVMTSRYEGFPMVLIEAAAKGLPMVSFDIETGPSEIIHDGINGYLIPKDDIDRMIAKLKELIDDPELRSQMSAAAKESVNPFRLERVCAQWQSLLQELENE